MRRLLDTMRRLIWCLKNRQIPAWSAVDYAVDHISDPYEAIEFLREARETDVPGMKHNWPDFVRWLRSGRRRPR